MRLYSLSHNEKEINTSTNCTNLFMKLDTGMIGQDPENTVVTLDSCYNQRGGPLSVQSVDLCTTVQQ